MHHLAVGVDGPRGFTTLPVERRQDPHLDLISGDRNCSYADAAFTADLTGIKAAELQIRLEVAGHVLEGSARLPQPAVSAAPSGIPFVVGADAAGENLHIDLDQVPANASFALVTARFRIPAESTRLPGGGTRLRFALHTERWGRRRRHRRRTRTPCAGGRTGQNRVRATGLWRCRKPRPEPCRPFYCPAAGSADSALPPGPWP